MTRRWRSWLEALAEVLRAVCADPMLLAPAMIIIVLAVVAAYFAWRYV